MDIAEPAFSGGRMRRSGWTLQGDAGGGEQGSGLGRMSAETERGCLRGITSAYDKEAEMDAR